jgi:hypothetical protein
MLVLEMGGEPFWVAETDRPLYTRRGGRGEPPGHAGGRGADLLRAAGVQSPARVLTPLLTAALDNGLRRGDQGLTGPVSRGDVGTVRNHLQTLADRRRTPSPVTPPWPAGRRSAAGPPAGSSRTRAPRCWSCSRPSATGSGHPMTASLTRPAVAETGAELRELVAELPGPVALVPTMGALHEGHRALGPRRAAAAGSVVVSVFVNPTQFGPGEDFDRYPRTWTADLAALAEEGAESSSTRRWTRSTHPARWA